MIDIKKVREGAVVSFRGKRKEGMFKIAYGAWRPSREPLHIPVQNSGFMSGGAFRKANKVATSWHLPKPESIVDLYVRYWDSSNWGGAPSTSYLKIIGHFYKDLDGTISKQNIRKFCIPFFLLDMLVLNGEETSYQFLNLMSEAMPWNKLEKDLVNAIWGNGDGDSHHWAQTNHAGEFINRLSRGKKLI